MEITLNRLRDGQCGRITSLCLQGDIRRRLMELGLLEGTKVRCLRHSPSGDPAVYCVRGTMLALRARDSCRIHVELLCR